MPLTSATARIQLTLHCWNLSLCKSQHSQTRFRHDIAKCKKTGCAIKSFGEFYTHTSYKCHPVHSFGPPWHNIFRCSRHLHQESNNGGRVQWAIGMLARRNACQERTWVWQVRAPIQSYLQKVTLRTKLIPYRVTTNNTGNIQACSCNHCWRGKAIRITYSVCLCVCVCVCVCVYSLGYPVLYRWASLNDGGTFWEKRRCANVCLHTPDNTAYYTPRLYGIAYCS